MQRSRDQVVTLGCALVFAVGTMWGCDADTPPDKPVTPKAVKRKAKPVKPVAKVPEPKPEPKRPLLDGLGPAVAKPEPKPQPKLVFAETHKRAKLATKKRDYKAALALYQAYLEQDENEHRAQLGAARALIKLNRAKDARPLAQAFVKANPKSSIGFNTLGRVELLAGRLDKAAKQFKKAAECNDKNIYAWNNLGLVKIKQQKWGEAVEALEQATAGGKAPAYIYNNLGIAYERDGQTGEALTAYKAGLNKGSGIAGQNFVRLENKMKTSEEG